MFPYFLPLTYDSGSPSNPMQSRNPDLSKRKLLMNTRSFLIRAFLCAGLSVLAAGYRARAAAPPNDGKLRVICFGAHPDDCELQAGGVAAMWAAKGHHVKFVSVTNGDIGHWKEAGGPLALRRKKEVEEAAKILGISVEVLDIHDGELMVTLDNRRTITR